MLFGVIGADCTGGCRRYRQLVGYIRATPNIFRRSIGWYVNLHDAIVRVAPAQGSRSSPILNPVSIHLSVNPLKLDNFSRQVVNTHPELPMRVEWQLWH